MRNAKPEKEGGWLYHSHPPCTHPEDQVSPETGTAYRPPNRQLRPSSRYDFCGARILAYAPHHRALPQGAIFVVVSLLSAGALLHDRRGFITWPTNQAPGAASCAPSPASFKADGVVVVAAPWLRWFLLAAPIATPRPAAALAAPTATPRPPVQLAASTVAAAPASNCHPSYKPVCLKVGAGDYDCAGGTGNGPNYIKGPFQVVGPDEFDLDTDHDGIGCE